MPNALHVLFLLAMVAPGVRQRPPEPVVPELPRVRLELDPATISGRRVGAPNAAALRRALAEARPGDVILLKPGVVYPGPFVLPAIAGSQWITIRPDLPDSALPARGTRLATSWFGKLPILEGGVANEPVVSAARGAHHFRFLALEIRAAATVKQLTAVVSFGQSGGIQRTLADVPHDLILDHVLIRGHPTLTLQRCLALNSARTVVVDSYLAECHALGMDAQAICGWNGPGPFRIENNYLEGSGEVIMFGGGDPASPAFIPSDIEILRNHITRPDSWLNKWTIKNLFELKVGIRVLVEGNVMERNWAGGQDGLAIVLKSTNQEGGAPYSETRDVTIRRNIVRRSAGGVQLAAKPEAAPAVPMSRIRIEQNFFDRLGGYNGTANGRMLLVVGTLRDIAILDNTMIHGDTSGGGAFLVLDAAQRGQNLVIRGNIATEGSPYGAVLASDAPSGVAGIEATYSSYVFARNLLIGPITTEYRTKYGDNRVVPSTAQAGFGDTSRGEYTVRGTDGVRFGADMRAIRAATAGVVVDAR